MLGVKDTAQFQGWLYTQAPAIVITVIILALTFLALWKMWRRYDEVQETRVSEMRELTTETNAALRDLHSTLTSVEKAFILLAQRPQGGND